MGYGTNEAMADVITEALLEQFFQRFLLLNSDDTILLLIGVDAPTEHQFYDITDAAMIAIGNSTNLVNEFPVADGVESHPVCSYRSHRRCCRLCRILIYIAWALDRCVIGTLLF